MNQSGTLGTTTPAHWAAGIPRVESPFFDDYFPEASTDPKTLAIARDLRDNGFAVFDFPDPDISQAADRIIADLAPGFDLPTWREGRLGSLRLQDAWKTQKDVGRIAANPTIISLLSRLYGRQAFPFQTLNFPVGTQQHYHSDSVHFSCVPERFMCGVWVALEDVDMTNGPLVYYPGSHRWPIYTLEHLGINPEGQASTTDNYDVLHAFWEKLVDVNGSKPQYFLARKGQALIWAANLLHGGDSQIELFRTRHSQVTHYYFEDCCYYTPLDSYPFAGRIFFREPTDISTGQQVKNRAAGRVVDEEFIRLTRPGALPELAARPPAEEPQFSPARYLKKVVGQRPTAAAPGSVPPRTLPEGFSPERYLKLNPDVAAAGADPVQHFLSHGFREGRPYR